MSALSDAMRRLAREIDETYREDILDYRGRTISRDHVAYYLSSSYHRTVEIARVVSATSPGAKVLDIGIGYGFYDILLKEEYGMDVCGMELAENIAAYCLLPKRHNINVIPGELTKTPCSIPDESFDVVIFSEVIEHLRISPFRALTEIKRMLRPGGRLVVTTPNIARLPNLLNLLLGKNIVEPLPDEDEGLDHITDRMIHIREYTMPELAGLMRRAGYEVVQQRHALANDRLPPSHGLTFKTASIRRMMLPVVAVVPRLRALLVLVGQKTG